MNYVYWLYQGVMLSSLTIANGEVLIAILRQKPNRFEQICLMSWKEKIQMVIKAQRSSSYIIKSILFKWSAYVSFYIFSYLRT